MKSFSGIFIFSLLSVNIIFSQIQLVRLDDPTNRSASGFEPEEVSITVNPNNPNILAAGANVDYLFISTDAGLSWEQKVLESGYGVWGDPSLAFDKYGKLYFGHLSNPPSNIGHWIDRIVVQSSTDNGETWDDDGVGLGYSPPEKEQDKEWVTVDITNSQYKNNVHVAWTEFDDYGSAHASDSSRILFSSYSWLYHKWSTPTRVSDTAGDARDGSNTTEGAVPAVGPNGEVYLSWSGPLGIQFDKSFDGGATWGEDIHVVDHVGGWNFNIPGISRCNGMPVTGCDISGSQYRGNIYINFSDKRNGDSDVFIIKSSDGGESWGDVLKVNNDDSLRDQFFTWMSVDPKTGYIYIVFYDRRNTVLNDTEVYIARSKDGGNSFENFLIPNSRFSLPTDRNPFIGDYINIAAYNGKIYPIWTSYEREENGSGELSVWVAVIEDADLLVGLGEKSIITEYKLFQNYPNPFNPSTNISFQIPKREHVQLTIYDTLGRKIKTLLNEWRNQGYYDVEFYAENLANGIYIFELKAGSHSEIGKMVLLK